MRVSYILVPAVIYILHSFKLSSQFECLPNGAPIPGVPRGNSISTIFDTQHPPARPHPLNRSPSHAEPRLRSRSRSPAAMNRTPPTRLPFSNVLGYGLEQLENLRLIPYRNPQRQFVLRRYSFPTDEPVQYLKALNQYEPVPNQEQIVLSTSDEDIFAILDGSDALAGIYTYNLGVHYRVRAKINMKDGKVTALTADEIKETPVGRNRKLLHGYRVEHLNLDRDSLVPAEPLASSRSRSFPRHMALPTRLPSSDGSGCGLDQLQFIRLIPRNIPNQIFGLRKYTFPADKLISLYDGHNRYRPIPVQELIVVTTDSGDVFAILESDDDLAGIYTYFARSRVNVRVKMNMLSGTITQLTKYEMKTVPVGGRRLISNYFKIQHLNHDSSLHPIDLEKFHSVNDVTGSQTR